MCVYGCVCVFGCYLNFSGWRYVKSGWGGSKRKWTDQKIVRLTFASSMNISCDVWNRSRLVCCYDNEMGVGLCSHVHIAASVCLGYKKRTSVGCLHVRLLTVCVRCCRKYGQINLQITWPVLNESCSGLLGKSPQLQLHLEFNSVSESITCDYPV